MTRARNLSKLSNTNILAVDSANQRVGIGTTNPKYPLHVVGVGSTSLFVDGSARITGVLSIGQGSVTIDGSTNTITATNIVANNITADGNVGYATTGYVNNALVGYATQGYVTNSLVGYATESYVNNAVSTKISGVGIQSAGISVTTTAKTLNFIGAGNTFNLVGDRVDISIQGGGGGGGSIGIQSGGTRVATGITDLNIAIGSTTSRSIVASGSTATVSVDIGDYYIFRKPAVGFATMRVLVAGSQGGIAYSDFYGGSSYVGLTTINTDQFPWVAGVRVSISTLGHLILESP